MDKKNVVLIGMPGAGKSTVGVVLAKKMGFHFIDSDILIQEQENRTLSQIIEQEGTDGFLRIEDRINSSIKTEKCVIATGGSVIYGENAMKHLKTIGTVVYLAVSYDNLKKRLGNLTDRGVALKEGQTLKDLYDERCPLYEKYADVTIDEELFDIPSTVEAVMHRINIL